MAELQTQLTEAKQRHRQLRDASQNPHADPVLKSLQLAIAKLEKQAGLSEPESQLEEC